MIQFVCYFFPAVLALRFDKNIGGSKSKDLFEIVTMYVLYVILINAVIYIIFYLFAVYRYYYFRVAHFNVSFTLKYLMLACPLAWIIPNMKHLLKKHLEVDVNVSRKV
ncbi:hypothetical protein AOC36_08545 [Erysipelothrix larvae]|uniref:Uncharacterized protein n=1 Tax=Erysipelothrix larvae TaxID=1514105 RepID=A0A109UHF4_9FIRM|nr:hypothetical protein [Erysipelothrix larvae]AMC94033.1 hypothetical protein AOC36_08545 [Erysipelothrix larvae]